MRQMSTPLPPAEWDRLGIRTVTGNRLTADTPMASLVSVDDRSFLVYQNYDALLRYNCAHHYALSVALFADELR